MVSLWQLLPGIKLKNVSCEVEDFIETHLCMLSRILRSYMEQNKDAVWPLVLLLVNGCVLIQSTRTHMISYVCTWGLLLLILHRNILFFKSVPGSRYEYSVRLFFFGFNNMRRNTFRSGFVRYKAKTWKKKKPCVAFRGQGDAAVWHFASMNDSYG